VEGDAGAGEVVAAAAGVEAVDGPRLPTTCDGKETLERGKWYHMVAPRYLPPTRGSHKRETQIFPTFTNVIIIGMSASRAGSTSRMGTHL
jgi:hypothetical protein